MTSHDVVAVIRRRLQIRKVGHCGTLDPIATGLLLLTLGRGTKIQDLLMAEDKEYAGTMLLGVTTGTQDKEGEVLERHEVPGFNEKTIRAAFEKFRGDFYQTPPMVSAIKTRRRSALQARAPGKNNRARAALFMFTVIQSIESRCPKSTSPSSAARVFMFELTRMISAQSSVAAHILCLPPSEIGAIRCRERALGRTDQKWRPVRNCRACAFVAAGFPDAGSVRGMTKLE